ncbi:MAG TPA: phosphodiester glycosidase family protein [Pedococcus sp.]|jgi:hypothetical protein|nr:phosphodiester glycosidase family protein [Pedococcus sp.]
MRRRIVVLVVVALVLWPVVSITQALTAPGTDTTAARLAEWARFHGLGWAVTGLEQAQYAANQPKQGGKVVGGVPSVARQVAPGPTKAKVVDHTAVPAPLQPVASGSLVGEGTWQTTVSLQGQPAIRTAFLRPDSIHTSYLVGVVWMDPSLVRFTLHPGYRVPGGSGWPVGDQLSGKEVGSVLATFNSGFTMVDAEGGYYQGGQGADTLRPGAASMVLGTNGKLDVRSWGGGTPAPGTAAVRQNLTLLVDKGQINPLVNNPTTSVWGKTVGNFAYVWRSAVGVRRDGTVVFIVGPALSVKTLAQIAQEAGAVRAMELDINQDWTNFITYTHPSATQAVPHMLTPDEHPNPWRYLQPSTRDFVSVVGR